MKVLVTGSEGFVGRHFVDYFLQRNEQVTTLDTALGSDCRIWFREHPFESFDIVVHCAAVVGGRVMIDGDPLHLACEDLSIDAAFFQWCRKVQHGQVVYFSSSAAYPVKWQHRHGSIRLFEDLLVPQDDIDGAPDQTYGWVKVTGEMLAHEARRLGVPIYVFRPFSGYGSDQHVDYPFPNYVRRALSADVDFEIWGDGQQRRDFVHIDDVVQTVMTVLRRCSPNEGPWNICSGKGTSFQTLATMCIVETGAFGKNMVYRLEQPVGTQSRVGDPTKSHQIYKPQVTLEEGIRRACAVMSVS
jgi:nucleoside-diphosphate-sugar epimerase